MPLVLTGSNRAQPKANFEPWLKKTIIWRTSWWTSASSRPTRWPSAREEAEAAGVGVVDLMLANKVVRPADVTQAKAAHFGAEVVNLSDMKIADDVISIIPRHIAKKYRVVPVFKHDNKVDRRPRRPVGPGHH